MDTSIFRRTPARRPRWRGAGAYGLALASSLAAMGLTLAMMPVLTYVPMLWFFAAVLVSARWGGGGPGLVATALTLVLAEHFVLPPVARLKFPGPELVPLAGYLVICLGTVAGLTQLRRRKEHGRQKDEQLTDFIENASIGLNWLAPDGRILWANKAELDLLGYAPADYLGRPFAEFVAEPEAARDLARRLAAREPLQNHELVLRAKDGALKTILLNASPYVHDGQWVNTRCFVRDITERTAAESALRESERRFRQLAENIHQVFWLFDPRAEKILYVSPAYEEIWGQSRDQLYADRTAFLAAVHPDDRPRVEETVRRQRLGLNTRVEYRLARADGSVRWIWDQGYPIRDESGVVTRIAGLAEDVTERHRAQDALADERNLLRTLIDQLPDNIFLKDTAGRYVLCNSRHYRARGFTDEADVRGKTVFDLFSPELAARYDADDRQVFTSGEALVDREEPLVTAGGGRRLGLTTKAPLRDADGRVIGLIGISRDITERQQAEEALRDREARLKQAQRIGRLGGWEADLVADTLEWSDETYRIFGCERGAFTPTAENFFARVHPADREFVRRMGADIIRRGKRYSVDYRIVRPDGTERYLNQQARLTRDEEGRALRMIGIVQDITERREAELALRASEERYRQLNEQLEVRIEERTRQLADANKELEAFSYSISHDLQAPLRAIDGFATIIQEDHAAALNPEAARLFHVIRDNTARMAQLIHDLLGFSRLARHEFHRGDVDVAELARGVVRDLTLLEPERAAQVVLGPLPPVRADAAMLRQVFTNLVGNALKFSRHGTPPAVRIEAAREGDYVVFSVRDNGVGFDMRYAKKLFNVFQRLHKADQFEGTGVGLAIAQRIVQRHGGRIWAEAEPGRGACFFFSLPLREPPGADHDI